MIASGLPNFIMIVCWKSFKFTFNTSYDNFFNFLNSIRAHVRYRAFATLQIELYCVVDYNSKWSTTLHNDCMLEIFVKISLSRRLMIIFFLLNSIRAHVRYRAFATLQIELYGVVDYDSKWSTKFHNDCTLEIFKISLSRRRMIICLTFSK